jgi:Family of unknown function (DUF5677)
MPDHEVSFGFHDFWQTAYQAFPRFWEVYPRLLEAINSLVWRKYGETNPLQHIIINLGIVGATSLSEITTLAGNGLGPGAMKIARSMLETAINAEFLRRFPEHLDDYFDWWIVERYKLMKYVRTDAAHMLSKYSKEWQDQIDSEFEAVKARFEIGSAANRRLRAGWCSIALDARATKTDFQEAYKLIYPIGNKLMHATLGGMAMHARKPEAIRVDPPPSINFCKTALVGGHMCAARMVQSISAVMNQEPTPTEDILTKDYKFAWEKDPSELGAEPE